jgi:hypothetical protein
MAALDAAIQQTKTQCFESVNWMAGSSRSNPAVTKGGDADFFTRSFAGTRPRPVTAFGAWYQMPCELRMNKRGSE